MRKAIVEIQISAKQNLRIHMNGKDRNSKSGNNKVLCPFFDELDAVLDIDQLLLLSLVLDASAGGISVEP